MDLSSWEQICAVPVRTGVAPQVLELSPDNRTAAMLTKSGLLHLVRTTVH
jgi:hypothetical protein